MPRGVPNSRSAVLDVTADDFEVTATADDFEVTETADPGYSYSVEYHEVADESSDQTVTFPIRAYNMKQEMERVLIPDKNPGKSDPELRKRIQFFAGSTQVRTQDEYDALATKSGVVFDNFPKGAPDHECPRCKRPFRNMQAFDAHVLTHME